MASKQLSFRIEAQDDASRIFQKLARTAKAEMGKVDKSLEDTRSNGEKLADALSTLAEDLDAELEKTKATADELARALGPELAARVDTSELVREFQRAGLTLDDVRADADRLGDAVRRLDDVQLRHLNDEARRAGAGVDDVSDSARGAKSALANMLGNSAQDLGELAGITGSLGVGIGQMAEYASDATLAGEGLVSSLGSMAKVAGPIAALGLAIQTVGKHLAAVAETKAFNRDRVDAFVEALEDAKVTAGELHDILAGTEDSGIFVRWRDDTENVDRAVSKFFTTFQDFKNLVDGGISSFDRWADAQVQAAAAAGAGRVELLQLAQMFEDVRDGSIQGVTAAEAVGVGYEDLAKTALALASAIRGQGDATEETSFRNRFYAEALKDTADAGKEATAAAEALEGAQEGAATAQRAARYDAIAVLR